MKHSLISDCSPGDVVRISAGLVRVCSLSAGGERWCRLMADANTESNDIVWIANHTPVLELVRAQRAGVAGGENVDPLMRRSL